MIIGRVGDPCPINVGDQLIFNPTKHFLYDLVGIPAGEIVEVEAVNPQSYTYLGLSPKVCWAVDFKIISTGERRKKTSSQYFGRVDEGVEF